ncbi:ParA family protein [Mariprofundus erugo]|uniref:ParA family protein n=1 Tax=Mariprofundus erugo TaxID=2528639 RepID=UPI0010FF231E|nr:ParA family protein [Mariprofundus erugo]TLS75968.1 ParA family protein [Mariprofundus erugo]
MRVIASYNIKGGVGKTTTAVNLAWLSSREGRRTLLWDLDSQGAAGYCFRVQGRAHGKRLLRGKSDAGDIIRSTSYDGLDLLPADFSYRNVDVLLHDEKQPLNRLQKVLKPLKQDYDIVILDCPPGLSLLSEAVFRAADMLVVPTLPSILSLRTLKMLIDFRKEHAIKDLQLLAFLTMVDRRKKLHNDVIESSLRAQSWMLEAFVPYASEVEQMAERREPVAAYAPHGRAGTAYMALWQEVCKKSGLSPLPQSSRSC